MCINHTEQCVAENTPCLWLLFTHHVNMSLFYHNKGKKVIQTESSSCANNLCSAELVELKDVFGSSFAHAFENALEITWNISQRCLLFLSFPNSRRRHEKGLL